MFLYIKSKKFRNVQEKNCKFGLLLVANDGLAKRSSPA